jgi:hypothetical protein
VHPIWTGGMHSHVVKDVNSMHYKMAHVQWWVHLKRGAHNDAKLYKYSIDPMQWLDIDFITFSFHVKKNTNTNNTTTINDVVNEVNHI